MRLILSKLLFEFDIALDEKLMRHDEDWFATQKNFGIWVKGPVWVKITLKRA